MALEESCLQAPRLVNVQDVRQPNVVDVKSINKALSLGELDTPGLFPHLEDLEGAPHVFAQEIWRRRARRGDELPEVMSFWQSKEHEIDFVLGGSEFLEVKSGASSPLEFAWFARVFPGGELRVINRNRFDAGRISGMTLEDFLLEEP